GKKQEQNSMLSNPCFGSAKPKRYTTTKYLMHPMPGFFYIPWKNSGGVKRISMESTRYCINMMQHFPKRRSIRSLQAITMKILTVAASTSEWEMQRRFLPYYAPHGMAFPLFIVGRNCQ